MVGDPLASVAVATPVALVAVFAGYSSVRLAGSCSTGALVAVFAGFSRVIPDRTCIPAAVVSATVMVWRPLALLPHASTAVQVRAMRRALPHKVVTTSL